VSEEFLHDLGMNAAIEQMGGGRMPEVVDPDSRESSLIEGSMKPFRRPGSVDWFSDWRRKGGPVLVQSGPAASWSAIWRRRCSVNAVTVPAARYTVRRLRAVLGSTRT
jgi:hypothetical protein